MKTLKLASRLNISFGIVILMIFISGLISFSYIDVIEREHNIMNKEYLPEIQISNEIERNTLLMMYNLKSYSLDFNELYLNEAKNHLKTIIENEYKIRELNNDSRYLINLYKNIHEISSSLESYKKEMDVTEYLINQINIKQNNLNSFKDDLIKKCSEYLEIQENSLLNDIEQGKNNNLLKERSVKISLLNQFHINLLNKGVINFNHFVRNSNFYRKEIVDYKSMLGIIQDIRGITKSKINIERISEIEKALNKIQNETSELNILLNRLYEINEERDIFGKNLISKVQILSNAGIRSTLARSKKEIEIIKISKKVFFMSLFAALIISIIIANRLGSWLIMSINRISDMTRQIGEGDFSAEKEETADDEIGNLLKEINNMADNLSRTTASKKDLETEILLRKKEEEKYYNLFKSMKEGFAFHEIITDKNGKAVDYRFISINPAFEKYTGFSAQDAEGRTLKELFPDIEDYWIEIYGKVALTGERVTFENYSNELDKYFSCSAFSPEKGFFAVVFLDITERKQMENLLAEEKEQLNITLKSIGDGVISTDSFGKVTLLNTVAEELTGWTTEEAFGRPLSDVFNIENEFSGEKCDNPVDRVLSTGEIVELANHTCLISRDGNEYIIEDSAAPIKNTENEITGIVLVFRDSTEKKKLEQSAIINQRMESLGILAGGIAHDFNNLLGGLYGYIELAKLNSEINQYDSVKKNLDKSMEVFERTKSLTQQLLTFSKGGSPKREVRDLVPILKKGVEFALSGSKISPVYEIAENLPFVYCDENQIGQCVDNIIINAVQAMPGGGNILISAEEINTDKYKVKADNDCSSFIKLQFSDTGVGIPEEYLKKIFDPFFSTKQTGHGLGLATVYSIIKHHDGWINIESEPGKGTDIEIFLPGCCKGNITVTNEADNSVLQGSGKILVMDDEESIQEILKEMLENFDFSVETISGGEEAVEMIADSIDKDEPYTACILDLTVPGGLGGKDVVEKFPGLKDKTALIAASGYSDDPVISNPIEYGFSDSLIKPFMLEELIKVLNKNIIVKDI